MCAMWKEVEQLVYLLEIRTVKLEKNRGVDSHVSELGLKHLEEDTAVIRAKIDDLPHKHDAVHSSLEAVEPQVSFYNIRTHLILNVIA